MRVLIVEDARSIAQSITEFLQLHNYTCDYAHDGVSGWNLARENEYDLFILDISLPHMSGLELCTRLQDIVVNNPGIMFLTARDTLDDKLVGFSKGCDDYLVKPFSLDELKARIDAIYERTHHARSKVLSIDTLTVNLETREVKREGQDIVLTKNCYKILTVLLKNSPAVVSRDTLTHELWADNFPDSDSLKSHIYRLRQEIDKPFAKPLIHTIQGEGFRIAVLL